MMEVWLKLLQRYWQGSAVAVELPRRRYLLGTGEPRVTVWVKRPAAWRGWSPSLVFGEAYTRGDIEVQGDVLTVLEGYYRTSAALPFKSILAPWRAWQRLVRRDSVRQAVRNARAHYDLGNEFYKLWLDPALVYSCAYFLQPEDSLAVAQQQKLELLCRKLRLQSGQRLLDIGCGWGGLLFYAAERYGAHVTGITPARQQAVYITKLVQRRGLADRVRVIVGDWRQLRGHYDRVVSVGMFEHVGQAQYRQFFTVWRRLLRDDGVSLLHTIGRMQPAADDPWIRKYIFPGGYLPTLTEITENSGTHHMIVADIENLWQHYALTLRHWSANFAAQRDQVVRLYDEPFARRWWLYLQGSEAAFRWGGLQLWQIVIVPNKSSTWPLVR